MIAILTQDLMMTSSVELAARRQGVDFRAVTTIEKAKIAWADAEDSSSPTLLLVDLQMPGLELTQLTAWLTTLKPTTTLVAYAQHVNVPLLKQARRSGAWDAVITRGQVGPWIQQAIGRFKK